MSLRLITGGKSNLTFELTSPAGELILRRPPTGELLPRAHDMGREVRVQRALAATPVPVARIVMADEGELIGAPMYVMEKVAGHVIRERLPDGFAQTAAERQDMAYAFIDTLAALHAVDPASVQLADYGRVDGYAQRQLIRWGKQWERSKAASVRSVEQLGRRLADLVPQTSTAAIVHGDYRLDNCVIDESDPGHVRAVLDWELSTLGDPLSDLGGLLLFWREPGERNTSLTPSVSDQPGFPTRGDLVDRYLARTRADAANLPFFEALAHYRFAVIVQGVATRAARGAMGGQDFGQLGADVDNIAQQGLRLVS